MYVINESTIEELVEYFRETEETRIDEDALDAYVIRFAKEHDESEFFGFDEAFDCFLDEMWISVLPEVFN